MAPGWGVSRSPSALRWSASFGPAVSLPLSKLFHLLGTSGKSGSHSSRRRPRRRAPRVRARSLLTRSLLHHLLRGGVSADRVTVSRPTCVRPATAATTGSRPGSSSPSRPGRDRGRFSAPAEGQQAAAIAPVTGQTRVIRRSVPEDACLRHEGGEREPELLVVAQRSQPLATQPPGQGAAGDVPHRTGLAVAEAPSGGRLEVERTVAPAAVEGGGGAHVPGVRDRG